MWYPSKAQWFIIWLATLLFMIGFLATDPQPEQFFLPAVLIGMLFCWHVSADIRRSRD